MKKKLIEIENLSEKIYLSDLNLSQYTSKNALKITEIELIMYWPDIL
jgi:hypothetical protein